MDANEHDSIIRQLVAIDVYLQSITDDLRLSNRQQLVMITELQALTTAQQAMNREQLAISQAILRLLENVTGQSSNGSV